MAVGWGSTSWANPIRRAKPFTPWVAPPPPTGSYDPALDSALGQAQRTYDYLGQDIGTANLRATQDYGLDRGDVQRQQARGAQDYGIQTQALGRAYQQLQRRQGEGMRQANILSGGIAQLAAAKRAENQGIEQSALDLANTRMNEDATNALGRIDLGYNRGAVDRTSQLTRAGIDLGAFKLDTGIAKGFQATGAGWDPGTRPANQGVNAKGVPYREKIVKGANGGKWIVRYDRNGRVLSRRRPK